jgi:hypothetical protein
MGAVRFDRSRWPIVVAELEGKPTDDDLEAYLRGLGELLQEATRGVLVIDMTRALPSAPEQRRRIGEWMRAHKTQMAERGLGAAFVIPSGLFRFVLSSIFLIQRPPMPYTVVATLAEALAWARARLMGRKV